MAGCNTIKVYKPMNWLLISIRAYVDKHKFKYHFTYVKIANEETLPLLKQPH